MKMKITTIKSQILLLLSYCLCKRELCQLIGGRDVRNRFAFSPSDVLSSFDFDIFFSFKPPYFLDFCFLCKIMTLWRHNEFLVEEINRV